MQQTTLKIARYLLERWYYFFAFFALAFFASASYLSIYDKSKNSIVYLFAILIFLMEIVATAAILKRKLPGQIHIKTNKRTINISVILITLAYMFICLQEGRSIFFPVVCGFYAMTFAEIITAISFSIYKPIYLAINDKELIINDKVIVRENLETLRVIKPNSMENKIILLFDDDNSVQIVVNRFQPEELRFFIQHIIGTSKHTVEIEPVVYKMLEPPPPPVPFFRRIGKTLKDTFLP